MRYGIPNSTSSRSPGFSEIPAYSSIPPSLNSVPRPETTVVENPFATATRTGRSTGCRCHRRVLGEVGILFDDDPKPVLRSDYESAARGTVPTGGGCCKINYAHWPGAHALVSMANAEHKRLKKDRPPPVSKRSFRSAPCQPYWRRYSVCRKLIKSSVCCCERPI
jgi:hypothetical protein